MIVRQGENVHAQQNPAPLTPPYSGVAAHGRVGEGFLPIMSDDLALDGSSKKKNCRPKCGERACEHVPLVNLIVSLRCDLLFFFFLCDHVVTRIEGAAASSASKELNLSVTALGPSGRSQK